MKTFVQCLRMKFVPVTSNEKFFISLILILLALQGESSSNLLKARSTEDKQKLNLSPSEAQSNINITFMGNEMEYLVTKQYDFFVPDVEVDCQCSCTEITRQSCSRDYECARLANSTTSCTIYITIDTDYSFCDRFYKLCCQVYFTKTKMMKSYKALELKYHQSLLKFKITPTSLDDTLNAYDVTITENVKHLLISPDKVLNIHQYIPARHIPDNWYFIEDGSNELLYSDAMNAIDELNMNKIGWFQSKGNGLSRVKRDDLEKQLQVKLLDCHSNPPIYEWKLNANYYVGKGLFHMPKNVETVSQMNKDISTISLDIPGDKITMGVINPSSVNITVVDASLHPFLFTVSIKEYVLNLTFTKGNGDFEVEITSPLWTDVLSFSASFPVKIIKLPVMNYDLGWVCVFQKRQQLCQIHSLDKYDVESLVKSSTSELYNNTQIDVMNQNATDFPTNINSSISNKFSITEMILSICGFFISVSSFITCIVLQRKRQKKLEKRTVRDEEEMTPLSYNAQRLNVLFQHLRKKHSGEGSTNAAEQMSQKECNEHYKGIQEIIGKRQRKRCRNIQLPGVNLPLEEFYVDLELLNTAENYEQSKVESVEDLFSRIDGEDPVRILIEGGPGYGKTTLCLKLLNDWGKEKFYLSSKFKMVFLFELQKFKENDSLDEVLKRECEILGVSGDDGINCIKTFQNETLLILDGFDEMNEECKTLFLPLLKMKELSSIFVVMTSKTDTFEIENRNKVSEFDYRGYYEKYNEDVNTMDIWHKRILNKGVTADKIDIYLKKYQEINNHELKLEINSITGGEMREVFQCPLFLILLGMMLKENTLQKINMTTFLYKKFFNFMIKRYLIREQKITVDQEIDLFNPSSVCITDELIKLINQFGQLAIENLCKNKLIFKEQKIAKFCNDKVILKLGFLTKIPQMEGRKIENLYEPIHKSFLEFLAAFAMWNIFQVDENQFKRELNRIEKKGLKRTNDSIFYVFLRGFMGSKAYVLDDRNIIPCRLKEGRLE